jgi:hypothetical protein
VVAPHDKSRTFVRLERRSPRSTPCSQSPVLSDGCYELRPYETDHRRTKRDVSSTVAGTNASRPYGLRRRCDPGRLVGTWALPENPSAAYECRNICLQTEIEQSYLNRLCDVRC